MSTAKENLDERIERIKRQTEEIEKKHREAEEDRLMALKMNALVTKPTLDDDNWPKAHKYDKLDFTYDVAPEKLEESNKAREEEKLKPKRDYKKFAEGEGPPPDPKYNFLADNERDGIIGQQASQKNEKFKQNSINSNNSFNRNKDQFNKRGSSQNNSFRGGRGNNFSNSNKSQQQQSHYNQSQNHKSQNKSSQPEQWRSNNDKILGEELKCNTNRNQNPKNNEKWKREWDNDKMEKNNSLQELHNSNGIRSPKHTANKNFSNYQNQQTNVHQNQYVHQPNSYNQNEYMVEKRGNITVSVSQTGEVKSVKLSSAPAIGTGRVGPRQLSKTNFQVQTKTTLDNDLGQTQYQQNSNNKIKGLDDQELMNNNLCKNMGPSGSHNDKITGSQTPVTELQQFQLHNMLQQQQQIKQQQMLLQQQSHSQMLPQQHQIFQNKYNLHDSEVPKLSQNHLLQQNTQELFIQKQLQQQQQQQHQQQIEQQQHQQLLLQLEEQNHQEMKSQQQDQLKEQALIQQLHHQQQKELRQLRQNLLKHQKQQQRTQSSTISKYDNNRQLNEFDKANAKNVIIKSPKKERKILKNNFVPKNELPSKIINVQMTVGTLQVAEGSNSQNIATTVIDPNVLDTVAKELSAKPEFAKKSVQDRLLRIRQNSNINNLISSNSEGMGDSNDLKTDIFNIDSKNELTESETITCK